MRIHNFITEHHKELKKTVLIALSILALCLPFIFSSGNQPAKTTLKNKTSLVTQKPNPASPETVSYPNTAEGEALHQSLNYLQGRVAEIPPFERLILEYLQRKYGTNQVFSASKTPIKSPTHNQQEDPAQYRAYARIAYPNSLVKTLPPVTDDPMSQMMLEAANCDHTPLPANFIDSVNQNIEAGQYSLTHVAFAMWLLANNRCNYFTAEQTQNLEKQVVDGMIQLASTNTTTADLRYEAIAFLHEWGWGDVVQQSWIDQMVGKQLPNGSWSQSGGDSQPRDHTTVVAVWALLAKNNPNAPKEPMIRRPN